MGQISLRGRGCMAGTRGLAATSSLHHHPPPPITLDPPTQPDSPLPGPPPFPALFTPHLSPLPCAPLPPPPPHLPRAPQPPNFARTLVGVLA